MSDLCQSQYHTQVSSMSMSKHTWVMHCPHSSQNSWVLNWIDLIHLKSTYSPLVHDLSQIQMWSMYSTAQTQFNKRIWVTCVNRNVTHMSSMSMSKHMWVMHCPHSSQNSRVLNSRMFASTRKWICEYSQLTLKCSQSLFMGVSRNCINSATCTQLWL